MDTGPSDDRGEGSADSSGVGATASRRRFLRLGAATTVGAVAGCSRFAPTAPPRQLDEPTAASKALPTRPDTIFQSDIERTGYWPDQSVPDSVELDWSIPDINSGTHTAAKPSPIYYEGNVIVGADTGTVYSFTPDGEQNWSADLVHSGRGTHGTPAIVDDYVFIAGYDGAVYAFDAASGDRLWRTKVSDAIGSSPVYYDGIVYVATEFYTPSGGMVALDATTGGLIWEDDRMTNHAHSITGIDTDTGRFAAGCNDGNLYVWELDSREFVDTFETGNAIKGPICMYDGAAIFGSWDGNIYAVDTETVTERWRYDTGHFVMSGPAVHPDTDTVVVGTHGDELIGLDVGNGSYRWSYGTGGWIIGGITIAGDTALAGSYDTSVYAVDVPTGQKRWEFDRPHGRVSSAPAVHGDDIYFAERASFVDEDERLKETGSLYKLTAA